MKVQSNPVLCCVTNIRHTALPGPVLHNFSSFQEGPSQSLIKRSALKRRKVLQQPDQTAEFPKKYLASTSP